MLYDISQVLTPRIGVWPGDTPLSREVLADMANGDNLTLSTLRTTVHVGTHADAPSHYGREAHGIEAQPLEPYLGRCQVLHVPRAERGRRVCVDDVFADGRTLTEKRVLLATGTFPDPLSWNLDFAGLEPSLVDTLAERGVILVGVDAPSVDPYESKALEAHQRFLAHDIAILEGLVLNQVPEGVYELIALPLKLEGFDGSPVRAVLRTLPSA